MTNNHNLDENGRLKESVEKNNIDQVKSAILSGADVNMKMPFNENLLFIACKNANLEIALILINKGIDCHLLTDGNQNAFHAACKGGSLAIVKELVKMKVSPNQYSKAFLTPVGYALQGERYDIIKYLLEEKLLNERMLRNLFSAAGFNKNFKKIFNIIFSYYQPSLEEKISLFKNLTLYEKTKARNYIMELFPEVKTYTPEFFPDMFVNFLEGEAIKIPIKEIANVTLKKYLHDTQIILNKIKKNNMLKNLFELGYVFNSLNANNQTFLHYAATREKSDYENVSVVNYLLDIGYPINITNTNNETPLHHAIRAGYFFHAIYLIYRGADVSLKDIHGFSALDYAKNFCAEGFLLEYPENIELKEDLIKILTT